MLLVEERHNMKVRLTDNEIRHIEERGDALKGEVSLDGAINPLNAVHLEVLNLPITIFRLELCRKKNVNSNV